MAELSGYDTEFVEPPQELQFDCSICLSILRDPQLFHCCGMSFCKGCIQSLISARNFKCPLCKGDPKPIVPDKRLQRQLNQRDVYCHKKKLGCKWIGLLADYDSHLNTPPSPSVRLKGCPFLILKCLYCNQDYPRGELEDHEKVCPQKPYQCEYCKDFTGTKYALSNQHYEVCPHYPTPCTNDCGEEFARCKLDAHLINDCPLTTVNCDYHYAGCDAWLMRRDLNDHLTKHAKRHATLLAEENTALLIENSSLRLDLNTMTSENMTLVEMNEGLLQEQERLLRKTREDENELAVVQKHLEEKEEEVKQLTKKLEESQKQATKAAKDHKKALEKLNAKESVLKTHTVAASHYRERAAELESKLDETVLESTKKQSLLEKLEKSNTDLQAKMSETESQISTMTKEMAALKAQHEQDLQANQFELERKSKIIEEQEKQVEKLKNGPVKPHRAQGGAEWPDPNDSAEDFNPYELSGSPDDDTFVPYTTYREHRDRQELLQPLPDLKENEKWNPAPSKKTRTKKPSGSQSTPLEPTTPPMNGPGWQPPSRSNSSPIKAKPPMNFSAALKKDSKPKSSSSTLPRTRPPSFSNSLPDPQKKSCRLMIRNTPSRSRGVTDEDIIQLFSQFGRVLNIDRNGSNTALVYDNTKSVTDGVVASDMRKLVCGGIVLNCTYENDRDREKLKHR